LILPWDQRRITWGKKDIEVAIWMISRSYQSCKTEISVPVQEIAASFLSSSLPLSLPPYLLPFLPDFFPLLIIFSECILHSQHSFRCEGSAVNRKTKIYAFLETTF
jgi:hypothetical protein